MIAPLKYLTIAAIFFLGAGTMAWADDGKDPRSEADVVVEATVVSVKTFGHDATYCLDRITYQIVFRVSKVLRGNAQIGDEIHIRTFRGMPFIRVKALCGDGVAEKLRKKKGGRIAHNMPPKAGDQIVAYLDRFGASNYRAAEAYRDWYQVIPRARQ